MTTNTMSIDIPPEQYEFNFDPTNPNWTNEIRFTGRSFNELYIKNVMNYSTNILNAHGYVFLNDILNYLDIPRIPEGQLVGWILSDSNFVSWSIEDRTDGGLGVKLSFTTDGIIYNRI